MSKPTVIENKVFSEVASAGDDCLHLNNKKATIKNCIFTREGFAPDSSDELLGVINGSVVEITHCLFTKSGKAVLLGTGDTNEQDYKSGQQIIFKECVFEDLSRRMPMVNSGTVILDSCIIKNWGKPEYLHLKSYGMRAKGKRATIICKNCVFEQESLWTCLTRGTLIKDWINHELFPFLGPGFMRGAYSQDGGKITTENCYKNRWWVYLQNRDGKMSNAEAEALKTRVYASIKQEN